MNGPSFTDDGFRIPAQDLSAATPGPDDHRRVFHHDASATITLTDGSTTSKRGWYMWDHDATAWFPMGQHADLVDGYHGDDLAVRAENETIGGEWDFETRPTVNDTAVSTTDHGHAFSELTGTATKSQTDFEYVPVSIPVAKWADGLSNKVIKRIPVPDGKTASLFALSVSTRDGSTVSSLSVDVYDETSNTQLGSDTADGSMTTGSPLGESSDGADVVVRLSNTSGDYQPASIQGVLVMS